MGAPFYNLLYPIPIGLLYISFILVGSDKYKNLLDVGRSAHRLFTAPCDTNRHVDVMIMVSFIYIILLAHILLSHLYYHSDLQSIGDMTDAL